MAVGDQYRRISPADQLVFDSTGALSGVKSGLSGQSEGRILPEATANAVQALVSDAGKPFDVLVPPLQQVTITGAISTTAALTATATGTYRRARVAWVNNGASGTAKLRLAANTDNDVHGLVAGQNVKRRDYELTMGDAVTLVCAEPITRLTFSADGAITSATHSIQVTFGS